MSAPTSSGAPAVGARLLVVVLAAWLGAAVFFAAAVAPAAFRALPSRAIAGTLVARTLPVLLLSGIVAGALSAALAGSLGASGPRRRAVRAAGAVLAASCALGQFVIGTRIARVRAAAGPALGALAPGDPRRIAFGRLHVLSVGAFGAGALAAGAALGAAVSHLVPGRRRSSMPES